MVCWLQASAHTVCAASHSLLLGCRLGVVEQGDGDEDAHAEEVDEVHQMLVQIHRGRRGGRGETKRRGWRERRSTTEEGRRRETAERRGGSGRPTQCTRRRSQRERDRARKSVWKDRDSRRGCEAEERRTQTMAYQPRQHWGQCEQERAGTQTMTVRGGREGQAEQVDDGTPDKRSGERRWQDESESEPAMTTLDAAAAPTPQHRSISPPSTLFPSRMLGCEFSAT